MNELTFKRFVAFAATYFAIAYVKDTALARYTLRNGMAAQKKAMDDMFPDDDFDNAMENVPDLINNS